MHNTPCLRMNYTVTDLSGPDGAWGDRNGRPCMCRRRKQQPPHKQLRTMRDGIVHTSGMPTTMISPTGSMPSEGLPFRITCTMRIQPCENKQPPIATTERRAADGGRRAAGGGKRT